MESDVKLLATLEVAVCIMTKFTEICSNNLSNT